MPLGWATTQNNLGQRSTDAREREGRTARLEEAVSVFREVLQERTRERSRWVGRRPRITWATHFGPGRAGERNGPS